MTVFVDTGVFYAHEDTDAARHDDALHAFEAVLQGEYGQPYTSDYVLDETITLTCTRTDSFEAANTVADRILGADPFPNVFGLLNVGPEAVDESLESFRQYDDQDLSFTDATTVHLCESRGIDRVLSFDGDFDGLVERIQPGA